MPFWVWSIFGLGGVGRGTYRWTVSCVLGYNISFAQDLWDMPAFICNGRYFLVTYSQCGELDPFLIVDKFSSLGAECIIGREHHEDGGLHLHVFVDFGRKFRSRKADIFDVADRHPNISPSKGTPEKGYDYAIKDGEVVAGGLERPDPRGTGSGSLADRWSRITGAENRDEFWELCHELDPKATACSFGQLQKYADWKFAEPEPVYESPGGLSFVGADVDGRDEWLHQSGIGGAEPPLGECILAVAYLPPGGISGGPLPLPHEGPPPHGVGARGRH